jgi:hypothetical protein
LPPRGDILLIRFGHCMRPSLMMCSVAFASVGCAGAHVAPSDPTVCAGICSEGSGYAPVARLMVSMNRFHDTLRVVVDSGSVGISSLRAGAPGPVLMARLALRAFVGHDLSNGGAAGDPIVPAASLTRGHAWWLDAESTRQPLVDTLRYGEVRRIPRMQFVLPLPTRLSSSAWLGFEITGDAMDPRAETPARGRTVDGVRVYVCDPHSLGGAIDTARATRLAARYTEAC